MLPISSRCSKYWQRMVWWLTSASSARRLSISWATQSARMVSLALLTESTVSYRFKCQIQLRYFRSSMEPSISTTVSFPCAAEILRPLHAVLHGRPRKIKWGCEQSSTFWNAKPGLSDATLLSTQMSRRLLLFHVMLQAQSFTLASISWLMMNESHMPFVWESITGWAQNSAFDRELMAIYLSIKLFHFFLEGRQFLIYRGHLPLTTAISSAADHSPQQARHLNYVTEFMTDLQHFPGKTNVVADV